MGPNQIKSLMALHEVTGTQIARDLGYTKTWISLVINKKRRSVKVQKAIAKAIRKPYSEVWSHSAA